MSDSSEPVRITLRLPADLHERITSAASESVNSLNGEIVARLRKAFEIADEWEEMKSTIEDLITELDVLSAKVEDHDRHIHPNNHRWK